MKVKELRKSQIGNYLASFGFSLYLLLQIGCGAMPSSMRDVGLTYDDVPCSPSEVRSQLRQYFVGQSMRTKEETDGKRISLITLPTSEESKGQRERRAEYFVEINPTENANKSNVVLKWVIQSKGVRERTWYDDEDTQFEPKYVKPFSQQIQNLCRSGEHS